MNLEFLKQTIEGIAKDLLGPKDDWLPTLFLEKDDGCAVVGLDMMGSNDQKEMAANIMYNLIKRTNADSACFVSTSWTAELVNKWESKEAFETAYDLGLIKRPSEHPNRKEVVTAVMVDSKGRSTLMMGFIKRYLDKPPEIARWKTIETSPNDPVTGRFGDAMRMGFKDADKNGNLDILNKIKSPREDTT